MGRLIEPSINMAQNRPGGMHANRALRAWPGRGAIRSGYNEWTCRQSVAGSVSGPRRTLAAVQQSPTAAGQGRPRAQTAARIAGPIGTEGNQTKKYGSSCTSSAKNQGKMVAETTNLVPHFPFNNREIKTSIRFRKEILISIRAKIVANKWSLMTSGYQDIVRELKHGVSGMH